ncbi:putative transmembrane protein [Gregarina niphandrodes]|uniref:Transmembrane protein n=1 Tax=Gregarina niphandrodes TaxID=110365 RepID=A0A023BA64_GRENI|nr:putative transmembrane protein [Gregarina niphandrodes]EZG78130.1 putative transmembrane protein [Gregarina niphandrodes]|eukprot:XP_011129465.1 putative transmembrane protein [Gregarina niphandrodes]
MKAVACLRLVHIAGGGGVMAALIGPDGAMSPISGCVAKMAVVSDGTHAAQVLVLAPPKELLASDMTDYDWPRRWNRLRVYYGPDESAERANTSERVERTLAQGLIEHVRGARPSVVTAILKEAFGKKLAVWHEIQKTRRMDAEAVNKLEVLEVRDLEDEERERLLTMVPEAWKAVVGGSRNMIDNDVEDQQSTLADARSLWKEPTFAAGLCLGAIVSGVCTAGLFFHLYGLPESCHVLEPSIKPPNSSITRHNSVDICKEATCKLRWPNIDDVTTLISESELAALRVPMDVCKKAYKFVEGWSPSSNKLEPRKLVTEDGRSNTILTTKMMPATTDGWRKLNWGRCFEGGGKVVCSNENDKLAACYNFGYPFRYDCPIMWEAVAHYVKPYQCSLQCNSPEILRFNVSESEELRLSRLATEVAGSIPGIDAHGLSHEQLQKLGRKVGELIAVNETCSPWVSRPAPYRAYVALPGCGCTSAEFSCMVNTPSYGQIYWGSIVDMYTQEEMLAQYYTPFKRADHVVTDCGFKCFQPVSDMTEQLLEYWKDNGLP